MKPLNYGLMLGFLATTTVLASLSTAQTIPGAAQPGRERENLAPIQEGQATTQEIIAPSTLLTAPANADEIKLVVKSITLTGNTAFSNEDLAPLYQPLLGKEITLADVYELANRITAFYRSRGYLISQAVVPPQEIEDGNVTIRIVEGFVDQIEFKNESGQKLDQRQLNKASAQIRASKPLNTRVLERQMLLLNDLAGVEARAVVTPSQDVVGAANLVIEVKQKRYSAEVQVDNRGSRFVGPVQIQARGEVNGVFTDHDQMQALYATTGDLEELQLGELRHIVPLGDNGLKGSWRIERSHTAPGHTLESFDVEGNNLTLEGVLSYPLIRSRQNNLEVYGGVAWQDLETTSLGAKLSDEKITTVRAGINYNGSDMFRGHNALNVEIVQGLDMLGASDKGDPLLSRVGADPQFTKVNAEIAREQFFRESAFSLLTAVHGQFTGDSLVASQEFGLGGSRYGRGYDPSEVTGDNGIAAKLEARYTGRPATNNIVKVYQPYAYYDIGVTVDNDTATAGRNSLASAGGGLRLGLAHDVSLEVEAAKPLTRAVATQGDDDWRAFFSLSKLF